MGGRQESSGVRTHRFSSPTTTPNPQKNITSYVHFVKTRTTQPLLPPLFFFSFSRRGQPLAWFPFVLELRGGSGFLKLRLRRPRELGDRAFRMGVPGRKSQYASPSCNCKGIIVVNRNRKREPPCFAYAQLS